MLQKSASQQGESTADTDEERDDGSPVPGNLPADWYILDPESTEHLLAEPWGHAYRLIQKFGSRLLVVRTVRGPAHLYLLKDNGVWDCAYVPGTGGFVSDDLSSYVHKTNDEWWRTCRARWGEGKLKWSEDSSRDFRELKRFHSDMKAGWTTSGIKSAAALVGPVTFALTELGVGLDQNGRPFGVRTCLSEDLDSNLSVMGFPNCVFDLATGRQSIGQAGAEHLCTVEAPDPLNLKAVHPAFNKLLEPLDPQKREFFLDSIAFALHGSPSRIMHFNQGKPGSGKTTATNAFKFSLGRYATALPQGAVAPDSRNASGPTPETKAVERPTKMAVAEEIQSWYIDFGRTKALSGGGSISTRDMYGATNRDFIASATMFFICNEFPHKSPIAIDEGMRERIRVVVFPVIDEADRDRRLEHLWDVSKKDPDSVLARQATLASVLNRAIGMTEPPVIPPNVQSDIDFVLRSEDDSTNLWLKEAIVTGQRKSDILTTDALWSAARLYFGAAEDDKEVDGLTRTKLINRAKKLLDLGQAERYRVNGRIKHGWRNTKLVEVVKE